jgi:hypothetical protein
MHILHKREQHYDEDSSRPPVSWTFYILTLQQAGAEEGADEDNGSADERPLAHVGHENVGGSSAGSSGRRRTGVGGAAGGVGGNSGHTAGTGLSSRGRLATSVLASLALKTGASAGTVRHVLVGTVGKGGELIAGECSDVPGVAVGRAFAGGAVGVVATVAGRSGVVRELLHKGLEVIVLGVGVAADRAEAVLGFFLRVLVDETAGVDGGHVSVVEGLDSVKGTGVLVAAVLGKAEKGLVCVHVGSLESPTYKRGRL